MPAILQVRDLATAFSSEDGLVRALRGVSFDLQAGESLGLVGESGCGKSVTALSIMRLLPPTARIVAGRVELQGTDLLTLTRRELRSVRGKRIAMIFQDSMTSLNPLLTVERQITESSERHLGLSHRDAVRTAPSSCSTKSASRTQAAGRGSTRTSFRAVYGSGSPLQWPSPQTPRS